MVDLGSRSGDPLWLSGAAVRLPVCVGAICSVQVWRFAEYKGFVEEGFVYFYAETGLVQDRHLAGFYFWLGGKDEQDHTRW